MKYIRTKYGIYEVEKKERAYFEGQPWLYYCKGKYDLVEEKDIIKQADTIEELGDEYVIHYANGYHLITINDGEITFKDNFDYGFKLKFALENDWEIYGSIWIDGELHKVAKMNDEGWLELL